jgi:hypothetical protein
VGPSGRRESVMQVAAECRLAVGPGRDEPQRRAALLLSAVSLRSRAPERR